MTIDLVAPPPPPLKRSPRVALAATLAGLGAVVVIALATRTSSVDSAPPRAPVVAAPQAKAATAPAGPPPTAPVENSARAPRPAVMETLPASSIPAAPGEVAALSGGHRTARHPRSLPSKRAAVIVAPRTAAAAPELPAREHPDQTPTAAPASEQRNPSNDDDVIDPFVRSR